MSVPVFLLLNSIIPALKRSEDARNERHIQATGRALRDEQIRSTSCCTVPGQFGHFVPDCCGLADRLTTHEQLPR